LKQTAHGFLQANFNSHTNIYVAAGDARWDIRMAAWLLYVKQLAAEPGSLPLWRRYLALLPQEQDMCCLLNYNRAEAAELQLPGLMVRSLEVIALSVVLVSLAKQGVLFIRICAAGYRQMDGLQLSSSAVWALVGQLLWCFVPGASTA
jgi:hypothetical protein